MRAKGLYFVLTAVTILLGLSGCGGGGGGGSQGVQLPTFVPNSVSDADYATASTAMKTLFAQVAGKPGAAGAMVAKMKTLKQFAYAEVSPDGNAFGWMTDGTPYLVNTIDPDIGSTLPATNAVATVSKTVAKPQELPGAPKAYLLDAMESSRSDPGPLVGPELSKAGYTVISSKGAVADFKAISDAGLVVFNCHGLADKNIKGFTNFFLSTSEIVDKDLLHQYRDALYGQRMGVVLCDVYLDKTFSKPVPIEKFAVTPLLLHESGVSFAKNSMLLNMACWSNDSSITDSMISSAHGFPGLAVYAGWTFPSLTYYASESVTYTIDRLLGLNQQTPVDATKPPPVDWKKLTEILAGATRADGKGTMDKSVLPNWVSNGATTQWIFSSSPSSSLDTIIPAITGYNVDASAQTLTVDGSFSATSGSVALDGTLLDVKKWSATAVTVTLPQAASGKLLVRDLGGVSTIGYLLSNLYPYSGPSVSITPTAPNAKPGDTVSFKVSLPSSATGTFEYDWTSTSSTSKFSAVGETNVGAAIKTTKTGVNLITSTSDTAKVGVTVVVYDTTGGKRVKYGQTSATVTISSQFGKLTPLIFTYPTPVVLGSSTVYFWTAFAMLEFKPDLTKATHNLVGSSVSTNGLGTISITNAEIAKGAPVISDGSILAPGNLNSYPGSFHGFFYNLGGGNMSILLKSQIEFVGDNNTMYTSAQAKAAAIQFCQEWLANNPFTLQEK